MSINQPTSQTTNPTLSNTKLCKRTHGKSTQNDLRITHTRMHTHTYGERPSHRGQLWLVFHRGQTALLTTNRNKKKKPTDNQNQYLPWSCSDSWARAHTHTHTQRWTVHMSGLSTLTIKSSTYPHLAQWFTRAHTHTLTHTHTVTHTYTHTRALGYTKKTRGRDVCTDTVLCWPVGISFSFSDWQSTNS